MTDAVFAARRGSESTALPPAARPRRGSGGRLVLVALIGLAVIAGLSRPAAAATVTRQRVYDSEYRIAGVLLNLAGHLVHKADLARAASRIDRTSLADHIRELEQEAGFDIQRITLDPADIQLTLDGQSFLDGERPLRELLALVSRFLANRDGAIPGVIEFRYQFVADQVTVRRLTRLADNRLTMEAELIGPIDRATYIRLSVDAYENHETETTRFTSELTVTAPIGRRCGGLVDRLASRVMARLMDEKLACLESKVSTAVRSQGAPWRTLGDEKDREQSAREEHLVEEGKSAIQVIRRTIHDLQSGLR